MPAYTFTPILSSATNSGYYQFEGINNHGQILFSFGEVYSNGATTEIIGPSGEFDTSGVAINNSGEVLAADYGIQSNNPYFVENVGGSPTAVSFALPPGTPTPPNGYSNFLYAVGLNDSGTVLGYLQDDGGIFPFIYSGGFTATLLPDLDNTHVIGLNNSGQIIGDYSPTQGGYLYSPNPGGGYTLTAIYDPAAGAGGGTYLNHLNNAGQILGEYYTSSNTFGYFLYSGGQYTTISDPSGTTGTTIPNGINDSGEVVGYYQDASGVYHGFVYSNGSYTTIDEPSAALTRSGSNRAGTVLDGVNSSGEIAGIYYDPAGTPHYFLAGIPPVTVTVQTANGLDLRWTTLYNEMANSPIGAGGTATQYTCVDSGQFNGQSAAIKFVVSGTGFTYSGSFPNIQLTGGTITGVQELDTANNVLATFTGLSISATTFNSAMASYVAGGASPNPTALNAIFLAQAYQVTGGAGSDRLQGGNLDDTFIASTGNDTINGGAGSNTADYSGLTTPGLFAVVQGGIGTVNKGGANGTDTLTTGVQNIVDNGTGRGNGDVFEVDAGENVTANSANFNYLIELSTNVNLTYSANFTGISEFVANAGTNTVNFAADTHFAYVYGSTGNDTLTLGTGGGYVFGEGGTNILNGGANATNIFEGGSGGTDTMNGGSGTASNFYYVDGSDTINGAGAFNTMIELVAGVTVQLGSATYQHVQEFVSDGGTNTVTVAGADADFVYLYGGAGNDTLTTGSGGGYLIGEGGTNVLTGGGGLNVFLADNASGIDTMNGGSGSNVYYIDANSNVHGAGTFNTVVELQQNVSLALGGAQLGSNVQEVVLNGGTNSVDFHTATGAVFLYGAAGNDTLFGGTSNDFLYGGAGTNTFTFGTGWGKDTIGDWTTGTNDLIDLAALSSLGVHAVTDLTQTIVGGNDVITSSHTGTNSITLRNVGSALTASSFHFT